MRLLIVTQKVDQDDSYFGFFHDWIAAFAHTCEQVTVIALECHRYTLPENVVVHSLGKEHSSSRSTRLFLFWKFAWKERDSYDAAFCHMSPWYVIAGFPIWKTFGKKIGLWYSHRHVDLKLRIAVAFADVVFSTSSHAFRLKTRKVHFMGHALDTDAFVRPADMQSSGRSVVAVGRITPIKRLEVLIRALGILAQRGTPVKGELIGAPLMPSDHTYEAGLHDLVSSLGLENTVTFTGSVPFQQIREAYWRSGLSVNLAPSGGMDKVVLEAAAAGIPVMAANTAFQPLFKEYADRLLFKEGDSEDLAEKMESLFTAPDKDEIAHVLQKRIQESYSLTALMPRIIQLFQTA